LSAYSRLDARQRIGLNDAVFRSSPMSQPPTRLPPGRRADYRYFHGITTRWMDNDVFQHVNNVNYFSYFDTAVTYYEMTEKVVGLFEGPTHCVVAEVACRYHSSLAFPDRVTVGIRVATIGRSSVRYEIAVFRNEEDVAAAEGYFVHVFVARGSQKPVPIPPESRAILERIVVSGEPHPPR
jgi:acyl-CoA thioester hydrolase